MATLSYSFLFFLHIHVIKAHGGEQQCKEDNCPINTYMAFVVPVTLKFINKEIGHGVFAVERIQQGTACWKPVLVKKYSPDEVKITLSEMTPERAHEYLRQAFVLPGDLDHLCVNVDDLGRFVNHSSNPNSGYADFSTDEDASVALRDIEAGEEITVDYGGLGSPDWYKQLCNEYGVLPTDEVARRFR